MHGKQIIIPIVMSACLLTACDPPLHSSMFSTSTADSNSSGYGGYEPQMTKMSNYAATGASDNLNYAAAESSDNFYSTSAEESTAEQLAERKLIRTVSMSFSIPSSDGLADAVNSVSAEAEALGGYVEDNNSSYGDYASGSMTLRVPSEKTDELIEKLKGSGMELKNISDSTEDVTLQYVDVESRLKVKQEMQKKYEEYLSSAANVEEVMSIEKELSAVTEDIESYQSQLNVLKNQVDYTSIHIYIDCKVSEESQGFLDAFADMLHNLGSELGETFIDAFSWFVNALVRLLFGIPILIIVVRAFMFAIGKAHKRKKKDSAAEAKPDKPDKAAAEQKEE